MAKLIAEIGINHLGDTSKLKSMINTLAANKIDSCKLQFRSSNDFFDNSLEMGSTLIADELNRVNLQLSDTITAVELAKKSKIDVGVSFFRTSDAHTFLQKCMPDYFKVPSAEALNFNLIKFLQKHNRPVYVSTGGLTKSQLISLKENISFRETDCIMYCVANYPTALGVSQPLFIDEYKAMFNCKIGYSSHDADWKVNIAFLARGAEIIERHFAENKDDTGLDISTSSDLSEIKELQDYCRLPIWDDSKQLISKVPNQGEIQNLKDLGSGYYFISDHPIGDKIRLADLEIKSPCRGLPAGSLTNELQLTRPAKKGEALSRSHLTENVRLTKKLIDQCNQMKISLPVRLHDYLEIEKTFHLENYEWHLSFTEVPIARETILENFRKKIKNKKFSIHLPDYISSKNLIDPLAEDRDLREYSDKIIQQTADLADALQQITGCNVPVVGSFSVCHGSNEEFYANLGSKIEQLHRNTGVKIHPQFLPKIAWYFGGAVDLSVFCNVAELSSFRNLPYGICLDTAHCIMAANYYGENPHEWIQTLLPIAQHIHISDASGIDGEGVPFGDGQLTSEFANILQRPEIKVVEQWEGHLNNFSGFKSALAFLGGANR
jgi:sialic acid synthase SpsE/sugar phosphate isomerase/epimerase